MIRSCLVAALLALPLQAAAQTGGLEGVWAWDQPGSTCSRDAPTDQIPIIIEAAEIVFYESGCAITDREPAGVGASFRLRLTCQGEGETWEDTILALLTFEDRLILYWESGVTFMGRRCP